MTKLERGCARWYCRGSGLSLAAQNCSRESPGCECVTARGRLRRGSQPPAGGLVQLHAPHYHQLSNWIVNFTRVQTESRQLPR